METVRELVCLPDNFLQEEVPFVVRGFIPAQERWSAVRLAQECPAANASVRFYPHGSELPFEHECTKKTLSLTQFVKFLDGDVVESFSRETHWAYMDYCHMETLFEHHSAQQEAARKLFPQPQSSLPVLWLSSAGASTRAHADSCGVNLVVQMDGVKRWKLACDAKPSRLPFEETTIFARNPLHGLTVDLKAGDALFVPFQWYHEVRCLTPSCSVNQWYATPCDVQEQAKEQLCRVVVSSIGQRYRLPVYGTEDEKMDPQDELQCVQRALGHDFSAEDVCRAFSHPRVLSEVLRVLGEG